MKIVRLLPLIVLAACTSGPTKEDAARVFSATSTALASTQNKAVAQAHASKAPTALTVDYAGSCALGGTVSMTGSYDSSGIGDHTTFDLSTAVTGCKDLAGQLDGSIHWTSDATPTGFAAALDGTITFVGSNTSATCDFNMNLALTAVSVSYTGSLCGYDAQAELHL